MPKSTAYKIGYSIEIEAKRRLSMRGADVVVRSSRSLTPVDLIAIFSNQKEIWLIQVKKEDFKSKEAVKKKFSELLNLSGYYVVKPIVFTKINRKYQFVDLSS